MLTRFCCKPEGAEGKLKPRHQIPLHWPCPCPREPRLGGPFWLILPLTLCVVLQVEALQSRNPHFPRPCSNLSKQTQGTTPNLFRDTCSPRTQQLTWFLWGHGFFLPEDGFYSKINTLPNRRTIFAQRVTLVPPKKQALGF